VQRVCVCGAAGRMGRSVVAAVEAEGDMGVVAAVDPALTPGEGHYPSLAPALEGGGLDVMVDFTQPEVVFGNARDALAAGVHAVIGTTGLSEEQIAELRQLADSGRANAVIAPNFAVGAVLMMRFAAEASRHMARAEIVELHHDGKLDAPSGTALRTAGLMAGEVPIHSVRLPGLVAHQEVIFGGEGQTLSIRHDSVDRQSFMPGVLLAVRRVAGLPDRFTVGLETLLDTG
jgi:4-hydroxy-tetrahydrodipicolinate reductase